jgi:hypothetical protein
MALVLLYAYEAVAYQWACLQSHSLATAAAAAAAAGFTVLAFSRHATLYYVPNN